MTMTINDLKTLIERIESGEPRTPEGVRRLNATATATTVQVLSIMLEERERERDTDKSRKRA